MNQQLSIAREHLGEIRAILAQHRAELARLENYRAANLKTLESYILDDLDWDIQQQALLCSEYVGHLFYWKTRYRLARRIAAYERQSKKFSYYALQPAKGIP